MSSTEPNGRSIAERIERQLALEILRGERLPGTSLPPVRMLAGRFGVTPPTVQRVVDRLAAAGLVSVRRGSGVRVNDPTVGFDLSLLPLWFEAVRGDPARAGKILADFLELRRVVAGHLVRTSLGRLQANASELAARAEAVATADDCEALVAADLAFTRAIVAACGQTAVAAVFALAERLVLQVPEVAAALYGDRAYHRRTVGRVLAALGAGDAGGVEDALASWDARAVRRLVRALHNA